MSGAPWIKLWTGIFDDEKIKIIQSFPEGDTIVLCWLKLLCMAGKCGAGGMVAVNESIPYTEDMLATVWHVPISTVKLALQTLEKLDMIDIEEDGMMLISNWDKYQSLKTYDDVKEQWRLRQQKHRQKVITDMSRDVSRDVTDKNIELEEELELEEDILSGKPDPIPFKEIVDYLNEKAKSSYRHTSKQTQRLIKARWGEGFRLDDFKKAISWAVYKWGSDEKMVDYLRPHTLFTGKMEAYIANWRRESGT